MSVESEDLHKAPSMQDQARGVPYLNTALSNCSPLLFDTKAHQGRTMITLQQQKLTQMTTPQSVSGNELRSVLSKGPNQAVSKRKNV